MADLTLADLDRLDALYEATPAGYAEILAAWPSVSAQLRRALAVPTCPCGDVDCKGDADDVEPPGLVFGEAHEGFRHAVASDGVLYAVHRRLDKTWSWDQRFGEFEIHATEADAIAAAQAHNAERLARQGTP